MSLQTVERLESNERSACGGGAVQRASRNTRAAHAPLSAPHTHSAHITDIARGVLALPGSRTSVEINLTT